jgi:hypothetical protein
VIQIDRDSYGQLVDAVGAGNVSSGATLIEDGYQPPPWVDSPWAGRNEYLASEALQLAAVPVEEIQAIRPPVPQMLFPPEQKLNREPMTISDCFDTAGWAPTVRAWMSGPVAMPRRRDLEDTAWSGSLRNVSGQVNPMG